MKSNEEMTGVADVLIVDDDYDIRDTMVEVLADHGYEAASAANGLEALTWLEQNGPPSLVLLDWMMPICDGACFRERQLADPELAKIPVVIVTAGPAERVANDVAACLLKPVDLRSLIALVSRYVARGTP
jgi:CheY-like chemotaxis protein